MTAWRTGFVLLILCALVSVACGQDNDGPAVTSGQKPVDLQPRQPLLELKTELVRALAFTSDSKQLAVGPKESQVLVYDVANGKQVKELPGLRGPAITLVPGPQPNLLYVCEKIVLRLVDLTKGEDVIANGVNLSPSANGLYAPRDKVLVLASSSGGVELLKADQLESQINLTPPDTVQKAADWQSSAAAFAADGKLAAGGRPNGNVYLWKVEKFQNKGVQTIAAHTGFCVDAVHFTRAGLLSLGRDGQLKLWNVQTAQELAKQSLGGELARGWLLAEGQHVATVSKEPRSPLELRRVTLPADDPLTPVATIKPESFFPELTSIDMWNSQFQDVALSPDGKHLAVAVQLEVAGMRSAQVGLFEVSGLAAAGQKKPAAPEEAAVRTWKSASGAFTVEAQLVKVAGDVVQLKRQDNGKVLTVPLSSLSAADQQYLKSLQK